MPELSTLIGIDNAKEWRQCSILELVGEFFEVSVAVFMGALSQSAAGPT